MQKKAYTPYPPSMFLSTENENREVDIAGPMARAIETVVWDNPLVAPSERLFGAEAVTNMNMQPKIQREECKLGRKKKAEETLTIGHIQKGQEY